MTTFIIAEAGVNHNGELSNALQLIDVAVAAGADAVKFQTFKSEQLVTDTAAKAKYQLALTDASESQMQMLKKLELPEDYHYKLASYCESKGIEFMSTAFDSQSLTFLLGKMPLKRVKIPSGELTNLPLVYEHACSGLDIILSTGMASIGEIEEALMVIAAGLLKNKGIDIGTDWQSAYRHAQGRELLKSKVTVLHCITEYPAPAAQLNLNAIDVLRASFGLKVGYSDHSLGVWAPVAAVAKGATIIEKHFTLDRNMEGPDHQASLEPDELKNMVEMIRDTEAALGNGVKIPSEAEIQNRVPARKSIVVTTRLKAGDTVNENNIAIMRPEGGMSPKHYWRILGKKATKDYEAGEFLCE